MSEANLPDWEKSNISDHFELLIGGTPSRSNENYWDTAKQTENRWVSIRDLKGKYLSETEERISELGIQKSNVKLIPENTVIMSFKLTIGRLSITKRPLYTNEAIISFIPKKSNSVETNYLYYGLQSWNLLEEVDQAVKGATLNKDKMSRIVGLFPPLPEQKKIASILTSVDEVIENTQKQIDKLQDLKKATMNELLTKGIGHTEFKDSELGKIPKEWRISSLGKCAVLARNQVLPSQAGDVPYIGLEHIQGNSLTLLSHGTTSDVASAKNKFRSGDILFGKLRPYLCKIIRAPFEGICSTDIWVIRAREGINQGFIYYTLTSQKFIEFSILGSEGTRMPRAKWNHASQHKIPFPPLLEQKKIASILTSMDENIEEKQRKLHKTESLKKSLMQDLLTGRVRVEVN